MGSYAPDILFWFILIQLFYLWCTFIYPYNANAPLRRMLNIEPLAQYEI